MSKAIPSKSIPKRVLSISTSFDWVRSKTILMWRTIALMIFIAAVSRQVDFLITQADRRAVVLPHAIVYFALALCGVIVGLSLPIFTRRVGETLLRTLLPKTAETKRKELLRSIAACIVFLGMLPVPLWTLPTLNAFLDGHIWLFVEANLSLVLTGFLTGSAWSILLPNRLWLALLFQTVLVFMMLTNILASSSW